MRYLPLLLLPLLAVTASAQKINDTLRKKDGSSLRGIEIVSMTLTATKYKKGSDTLEVAAHQVASVDWSEPPESFQTAQSAMQRRDYETAKQLFGEAVNKTDRAVLKVESKFLQCRAAVAAAATNPSTATDAAGALTAWIGENADYWRMPEAMLLLGRSQRLAGLGADAQKSLQDLDDRATREAWGPVWNARAKYEMALALLDQQKAVEARAAFQSASSAADSALSQGSADSTELKALQTNSLVGEGETYINDKDYAQALSFFSNLGGRDNQELIAAAKAGEGQAIYLKNADSKPAAEMRKAQIALATACVLDIGSGETSAKANYYLGLCLTALGQDREGDAFKGRARAYFQIVVKNYPTSRWASLAQAELSK